MILLRRRRLLAATALLLAVLAGCQQDRQPSTAPATTTSIVAPTTTTRPPVTAAERAWVAGVARLGRRIDRVVLQSDVVLTQRLLREYIAALRSCTPGLARLGPPTGRLRPAAAIAKDACRDYERGAATYRRLAPMLAVGATGEVSDLLQQAAEHEGNGSNGLRRAEVEARLALA
jgi:hypothetical protein